MPSLHGSHLTWPPRPCYSICGFLGVWTNSDRYVVSSWRAHRLPGLAIVRYQELSDILALRPPTDNLLEERNRLRAVKPRLVMAGETNEELDMEILSKRADGSNKVPCRPPAARRPIMPQAHRRSG